MKSPELSTLSRQQSSISLNFPCFPDDPVCTLTTTQRISCCAGFSKKHQRLYSKRVFIILDINNSFQTWSETTKQFWSACERTDCVTTEIKHDGHTLLSLGGTRLCHTIKFAVHTSRDTWYYNERNIYMCMETARRKRDKRRRKKFERFLYLSGRDQNEKIAMYAYKNYIKPPRNTHNNVILVLMAYVRFWGRVNTQRRHWSNNIRVSYLPTYIIYIILVIHTWRVFGGIYYTVIIILLLNARV